MNIEFVSVKEPALAVEPLIDDTTSKQPLSTTVETTVDIKIPDNRAWRNAK